MSALLDDQEYDKIPNIWNKMFETENDFIEIDQNFIISRDKDNQIISLFKDNIWDLSPYYNTKKKTKIYFEKIKTITLKLEVKKLLIMLMLYKNGRNNSFLSAQSITQEYYGNCLFILSEFAYKEKVTIVNTLSDKSLLKKYITQFITSKKHYESFSSFLSFLQNSNKDYSNFIKYDLTEIKSYLKNILLKKVSNKKQTEVIPSRILYNSLLQRWEQIDEIINHKDSINILMINIVMNKNKKISSKEWIKLSNELELTTLFNKYGVKNKVTFTKFFYQFQGTCKHLIHAYTGMRDSEAMSLKNNCLIEHDLDSKILRIIGITTKLHGAIKQTNWVTSKEMLKVIEILQYFNKSICNKLDENYNDCPLFISTNTLKKGYIELKYEFKSNRYLPLTKDSITIKEEDIL